MIRLTFRKTTLATTGSQETGKEQREGCSVLPGKTAVDCSRTQSVVTENRTFSSSRRKNREILTR